MCRAQRGSEDTVRWWFDPPEADRRTFRTMSGLGRQHVNDRMALLYGKPAMIIGTI